jgi:hypothetical protein
LTAADAARQALVIHPAVRLADGTHYVVALRDLKNASGGLIPPPLNSEAALGGWPGEAHPRFPQIYA